MESGQHGDKVIKAAASAPGGDIKRDNKDKAGSQAGNFEAPTRRTIDGFPEVRLAKQSLDDVLEGTQRLHPHQPIAKALHRRSDKHRNEGQHGPGACLAPMSRTWRGEGAIAARDVRKSRQSQNQLAPTLGTLPEGNVQRHVLPERR
jgi:hypothetical protein